MSGESILAVDAGTTGVTCLVLDVDGTTRGQSYAEFGQHYPAPGHVEHDPEALWTTTLGTAREALRGAAVRPERVAGIGITNQRETTLVWDRKTGTPIHNAIVWQDRRTAARCRELRADHDGMVREKTGLRLDPYFSASKLEWLLDHHRGARKRGAKGELLFGTVDSWLAYRLTGRHVTDVTNASRTLLWDIKRSAWDSGLLDLFDVPEAMLPEVHPSAHPFGTTPRRHLGAEIPLLALVGDQQAALFGQRCHRPGQAKCTYGTGAFLLQHTGTEATRSAQGLLTTRAAQTGRSPQYALEGAVFTAGAAIQWLRDSLCLVASPQELDRLAEQAPDSNGAFFVPAFNGLGAPHWDPDARGAWLGLTAGVQTRHMARATLEAIALQCVDVLGTMEAESGHRIPRLRVDGGAARSDPLLQIQADLLQRPVVRPERSETTAIGAGMLAGVAGGMWRESDLHGGRDEDAVFRPKVRKKAASAQVARWREAVAAVRAFPAQDG